MPPAEEDMEEVFSDQAHMNASFNAESVPDFLRSFREEMNLIEEEKEEEEEKEPIVKQRQKRRSSVLKTALQNTFTISEELTVMKVLNQINRMEERQLKQGFNEKNFTFGVINCFVVAYLFGAHPEHFWIVYLVESLYYIPLKFYKMWTARPLNQALYYFDFCWMMNFNAILSLILVVAPIPIPPAVRRFVFRGSFGIACGPLLGATLTLPFVAFVFHDLNTMCNVVIHALPPMMLYTMRWHADEIREAWPEIFRLKWLDDADYFPNGSPLFVPGYGKGSIAGNAMIIYLLWFIPYTSWMLLMGMDLPRKNLPSGRTPKYDTVFHSFWRSGMCITFGTMLWKRPAEKSAQQQEMDDYEVRDFLFYMVVHFCAVMISIPTLGYVCDRSKPAHMCLMTLVLLAVVHRGSQRYTYYTTKMFSRTIKKEFLSESNMLSDLK